MRATYHCEKQRGCSVVGCGIGSIKVERNRVEYVCPGICHDTCVVDRHAAHVWLQDEVRSNRLNVRRVALEHTVTDCWPRYGCVSTHTPRHLVSTPLRTCLHKSSHQRTGVVSRLPLKVRVSFLTFSFSSALSLSLHFFLFFSPFVFFLSSSSPPLFPSFWYHQFSGVAENSSGGKTHWSKM